MFILKPSFAAGELSPALYGRTDLAKYDIGAACLENFIVLRYGGIRRRPGLKYLANTYENKKARLIPFNYSVGDNYVIEITAGKFKFYRDGRLLMNGSSAVEVANNFSEEDLAEIKYTQSADMIFITHPKHFPMSLTRNSATDWSFSKLDISAGPFEDANVGETKISSSATTGDVTLTASADYFTSDMEGQLLKIGHTMKSQYIKFNAKIKQAKTSIDLKQGTVFVLDIDGIDTLTFDKIKVTWDGSGKDFTDKFSFDATTKTLTCIDNNFRQSIITLFKNTTMFSVAIEYSGDVSDSGEVLLPPNGTIYVETFGFWSGTIILQRFDDDTDTWVDLRSQTNNHTSNYNFTETNESNVVKKYRIFSNDFDDTLWPNENEKQKGYVVLQCFASGYYGIVKITQVNSARNASATVIRRLAETTATSDFSMQAWSVTKGFPACVGFYEDRLVFAGSKKHPQTYWLSKTGDYLNFDVSVPQQDDDAITGTLNNGQMNGIKAMVAFGELILLTAGGEYKLSGGNNAITPSNQQAKAQEYRGINNLMPIVCGGRIVYIQSMGSIVRDFSYSYEQDKYTGDDVSLLASHLFEGHTIVSIAYQQTPNSIVWCVRDDGVLLGMTYIKEQDVFAWHKHTTQGKFVDVCCISGEAEDNAYFVVERDGKHYIEMMASQIDVDDEKQQYFVDSYTEDTDTNIVEGLERLEGKDVQILADGSVFPSAKVVNNKVALGAKVDRVVVGLGYASTLETMPIEFNGNDGTFLSRKKRLSKLMILFKNSRGGLFGCKGNKLAEIKWRSSEAYGDSIKLKTGKQYVVPASTWTDTLSVVVKQEDPLPMSILSIVPEIVAGG